MRLRLDRHAAVSLPDQLKAQIRYQILTGLLPAGQRLPPVRTLAGFLRINRNTVARAYAELEAEGVVDARPGRGTVVVWTPPPAHAARALAAQIDRLLTTAAAAGVTVADLQAMLAVRARPRRPTLRTRPRLGFVECNPVDLAYFGRLVQEATDVPVVPLLLDDLVARPDGVDLVATTFFHVEEVRRRCAGLEVVGLMASPDFRALDELARLPRRSRIALVCATVEGVRSKARSLAAVGLRSPRLRTATLAAPATLAATLADADVVLAAPRVLARIRDLVPARARVVPFASVLSDGAVAVLQERIAAWRARHAHQAARRASA